MQVDTRKMPNECVVGVYATIDQAQAAVVQLDNAGYTHEQVSVVVRHLDPDGKTAAGLSLGDDSLRDALVAPLLHLVRNAVDHGIEASDERSRMGKPARGRIVIETTSVGDQSTISVTDDGRGLNPDLIKQIFQPGFSTATEITEISGRGVGLDVVATTVTELGGSIDVNSEPGKGSTFRITLKNPS